MFVSERKTYDKSTGKEVACERMEIHPYRMIARESKELVSLIFKLGVISPFVDGLEIHLVPSATVQAVENGGTGFAAFGVRNSKPMIYVGCKWLPSFAKDGVTREEWAEQLKISLAHEWAHMEQYRDGRPLTERGVHVRAKSLLKKCEPTT